MGRRAVTVAGALAIGAVPATGVLLLGFSVSRPADAAPATSVPPRELTAGRMRPRPFAVAPGTRVASHGLFTDRVFADDATGVALANQGGAQYPVLSRDGGRTWRIDGPQLHVDAADGAEGVGSVGLAGARRFYAYGSSVVDVTADGGRSWWETFLGELVVAVVPGPGNSLVAFVEQPTSSSSPGAAVTWQYVSVDAGRHWRYTTRLGG